MSTTTSAPPQAEFRAVGSEHAQAVRKLRWQLKHHRGLAQECRDKARAWADKRNNGVLPTPEEYARERAARNPALYVPVSRGEQLQHSAAHHDRMALDLENQLAALEGAAEGDTTDAEI